MSQRIAVLLLTVVLFIIGAAVGTPGEYPLVNGTYLTPELLLTLITPIVAGILALVNLFAALSARITSQAINPNDIIALLKSREFLVYFVALVAGVLQLFNADIPVLNDASQVMIIDLIMIAAALLLRDYAKRPDGHTIVTGIDGASYAVTPPKG